MLRLTSIIEQAQSALSQLITRSAETTAWTPTHYQRYLSMQYHLTRGVQRYFFMAAAHPSLARRRALRQFLVDFANEEELHYLVARNDLDKLSLGILPEPFDVTLWHCYFGKLVLDCPFLRLGAACVLESISAGVARAAIQNALAAPFLTRANTKFLVLHQHETQPHGAQIIAALTAAVLEDSHVNDVLTGARQGMVMYLRMAEWAIFPDSLSTLADSSLDCNEGAGMAPLPIEDVGHTEAALPGSDGPIK